MRIQVPEHHIGQVFPIDRWNFPAVKLPFTTVLAKIWVTDLQKGNLGVCLDPHWRHVQFWVGWGEMRGNFTVIHVLEVIVKTDIFVMKEITTGYSVLTSKITLLW